MDYLMRILKMLLFYFTKNGKQEDFTQHWGSDAIADDSTVSAAGGAHS